MNPTDPKSPEPKRETLFEAHIPRDGSALHLRLISSSSGRPPSFEVARTLRSGAIFNIVVSPVFRCELLDAVKRWCQLVDAHEARGGPASPRTSPPAFARPGASSGHGGGR